ncbi:hypothetical protein TNCT_468781 [Trichonephila clavata]|uniref:Uncharacterized protein n=1 Tax=Trichonephila clavata TaxID=2740835 RepID=A0A8X6HML7_TRICU|nr:hypothetical protein TNCT_468781 [Trichonephila clavata]
MSCLVVRLETKWQSLEWHSALPRRTESAPPPILNIGIAAAHSALCVVLHCHGDYTPSTRFRTFIPTPRHTCRARNSLCTEWSPYYHEEQNGKYDTPRHTTRPPLTGKDSWMTFCLRDPACRQSA